MSSASYGITNSQHCSTWSNITLPSQARCSPCITPLTNYRPSRAQGDVACQANSYLLTSETSSQTCSRSQKSQQERPLAPCESSGQRCWRRTGTTCKNTIGCALQNPEIVPPKQQFPPKHHSLAGSNGTTKPSSAQGTHPSPPLDSGPRMLF